jgi:hypothetical protein
MSQQELIEQIKKLAPRYLKRSPEEKVISEYRDCISQLAYTLGFDEHSWNQTISWLDEYDPTWRGYLLNCQLRKSRKS